MSKPKEKPDERPASEPEPAQEQTPDRIEAPDPFDPQSMRLDPADELVAVKRVLLQVPVRKPNGQKFVRVHADAAYRLDTALVELKEEREIYYLNPALRSVLGSEAKPFRLYLAVYRDGTAFLWPVRLPGSDGRDNPWWQSAHKAAELATRVWARVLAPEGGTEYQTLVAGEVLADPEWPELEPRELLRLAFKGYYIDNVDHPVVRRLRGLV